MKNLKKSLYIILPILFVLIIHLLFAYGNYGFKMSEWQSGARATSAFIMFWMIGLGVFVAHEINAKKD